MPPPSCSYPAFQGTQDGFYKKGVMRSMAGFPSWYRDRESLDMIERYHDRIDMFFHRSILALGEHYLRRLYLYRLNFSL
jgi:hypothetical protein